MEEKECHKKVDIEDKVKGPKESPVIRIGIANNLHFGNVINFNAQPQNKLLKIVSEKNAELESIMSKYVCKVGSYF